MPTSDERLSDEELQLWSAATSITGTKGTLVKCGRIMAREIQDRRAADLSAADIEALGFAYTCVCRAATEEERRPGGPAMAALAVIDRLIGGRS